MPSQPNPTLIGSGSDACVGTWSCDMTDVVQALQITHDVIIYVGGAAALFIGFAVGLKLMLGATHHRGSE